MSRYQLEIESDGNLGIYFKADASQPQVWLGNILEPESVNPVLALGTPLGILGIQKILALFEKWKAGEHSTSGERQPSAKSAKVRAGTRKWRNAYRARK
jgi:hypothetical protein